MKKDIRARVPISALFQLRQHIKFKDSMILTGWIAFVCMEKHALSFIKEGPHE